MRILANYDNSKLFMHIRHQIGPFEGQTRLCIVDIQDIDNPVLEYSKYQIEKGLVFFEFLPVPYLEYNPSLDFLYYSDKGSIQKLSSEDFKSLKKVDTEDSEAMFLKYCAETEVLLACGTQDRSVWIMDQRNLVVTKKIKLEGLSNFLA